MQGNLLNMHCSDEVQKHSRNLVRALAPAEVKDRKNCVPLCEICGKVMKPRCMFFDESYNEHYYKKETIGRFEKNVTS